MLGRESRAGDSDNMIKTGFERPSPIHGPNETMDSRRRGDAGAVYDGVVEWRRPADGGYHGNSTPPLRN
jgi:hypothetical protein